MADTKPSPNPAPKPTNDAALAKSSPFLTLSDDPSILTEGGTVQKEPKPEDYPAGAKITPPAEQLNPALSQAVGAAAVPEQIGPSADAAKEGGDKAQDHADAAIAKTDKAFEAKAKADEDEG